MTCKALILQMLEPDVVLEDGSFTVSCGKKKIIKINQVLKSGLVKTSRELLLVYNKLFPGSVYN